MAVKKVLMTKTGVTVTFSEITLLSIEEYEEAKDHIPAIEGIWWWLRSPGLGSNGAALVLSYGGVGTLGDDVSSDDIAVRPALRISDPASSDLEIGDKVELAGHRWTAISDDLILCDEPIGEHRFRNNREAADANVYEASDVKHFIEKWAEANGIVFDAA